MANDGTQVRTIPLSGGMQDDVPEFIQEAPSLAYIENGRFCRVNEVEKRLPHLALSDTGLPTTGTPVIFTADGDTLTALDNDGVLYTLDNADETTWDTNDTRILPYDLSVDTTVSPAPGMGIVAAGESLNPAVRQYKLVAWEERRPGADYAAQNVPLVDLVVELRRPDGSLLDRTRIAGGRSPKIRNTGAYANATCFYCDDAGEIFYATESGGTIATGTTGITTDLEHPDIAGYVANDVDIANREDLRIGYCEDGGYNGLFDLSYAEGDEAKGVMVYKVGLQLRAIKMLNNVSSGSYVTVATDVAGNLRHTPLSCACNSAYTSMGVLYAQMDTSTGLGTCYFEQLPLNPLSATPTYSFPASVLSYCSDFPRVVNASLIYDNNGPLGYRYAYTVCGGDQNRQRAFTRDELPSVVCGKINTSGSTFVADAVFRDCRLVSEVTRRADTATTSVGHDLVFAIEQWAPHAMAATVAGGVPSWTSEFASSPVLIKPVTTIVVNVPNESTDGSYIIAALGAGQNKGYNASSSEQNTHLNSAWVVGDEPRIVTRTILQPEDISFHKSDYGADPRRKYKVLFPGEAQGKVIKLTPSDSLRARKYGRNTIISSAIPAQYDGLTLGEASVLDQPEVTYCVVRHSAGWVSGLGYAYEQLLSPSDSSLWSTVQVVTGFTDAYGQLHRSAPSTPLWVSGIDPASLTDTYNQLEVGFTRPVSSYFSNKDYFVEVFIAIAGATPKLAYSQRLSVYTGGSDAAVALFTNLHYTSTAQLEPARWSEVLYTEGDVLPSDPWPSFKDFVVTSNRMFAISAENPGTVYYSKLFEPNIAPEFSAALVIDLGRTRQLTGIGSIDDKVVVFTDNEIFVIYDTGPDNTGANGDFIIDRLTTTNGCKDPQSLVEMEGGLFFYSDSAKTFQLITSDLQVLDIGSPVTDLANTIIDIKDGLVVPSESEVRWYINAGGQYEFGVDPDVGTGIPTRPPRPRYQNVLPTYPVLVYNYGYKKWCVHSNVNASRVILYNGLPAFMTNAFNPYITDGTAWGSDTTNLLKLRLPWLRIATLQTLGRVDELAFLGKYLSDWADNGSGLEAGDVQVTLTYDYEGHNADSDVYRFRANRGDLGTARMQFSAHPGRPKCQAVQIEIAEIPTTKVEVSEPTYTSGRGFALSGVDVISRQKRGLGTKTTDQRTKK